MISSAPNLLVVLGPTASGKTALGARLAHALGGEVISADSRQVYRGLDIGSGKDLGEYVVDGKPAPYHLIDIVDLDLEFSLFDYQRRCFAVIEELHARGVLPVLVGGTGLYLSSVLSGYRMAEVPENPALSAELAALSDEALAARLRSAKDTVHNTTDLVDRDRTIRAIEIAEFTLGHPPEPAPAFRTLVLGTRWERPVLRERIARRLRERLDAGLVEEVQGLLDRGVTPGRLHALGLEYRHVVEFLDGTIKNRNDLLQKLTAAIGDFAKRQETWFRRMERDGTKIHWIDRADFDKATDVVRTCQVGRR